MESIKVFDLFISHAWFCGLEYNVTVNMLNNVSNFYWRNYSFPEYDTVIDPNSSAGKRRLIEELDGQIKHVDFAIILTDLYPMYKEWIEKEVEIANHYHKPIIMVKPSGDEPIPTSLSIHANEVVSGDANSIISAIKKLTS